MTQMMISKVKRSELSSVKKFAQIVREKKGLQKGNLKLIDEALFVAKKQLKQLEQFKYELHKSNL